MCAGSVPGRLFLKEDDAIGEAFALVGDFRVVGLLKDGDRSADPAPMAGF